jgi:hypothetical protein
MNKAEMIAILAKSSGESLERPDPEEEKFCVCGDLLDDGGEHYTHMSGGY